MAGRSEGRLALERRYGFVASLLRFNFDQRFYLTRNAPRMPPS